MARFRYGLQPALDVALAREREALGVLRRARDRCVQHRNKLERLATRQRELSIRCGPRLRTAGTAAQMLDLAACNDAHVRRRHGRLTSLSRAEAAVVPAEENYRRVVQHRSALERLRAAAYEAWKWREELREAADLDEANAMAQARGGAAWNYAA
jgi:flagellar export protein FliJ